MSIIDPLYWVFEKVCASNTFQERTTHEKLHEQNDRVYKTTILKRNYAKYNAYFDGIGKKQIEYSKFKD